MMDKLQIVFHLIVTTRSFMILEVIKGKIFLIAYFVTQEELD